MIFVILVNDVYDFCFLIFICLIYKFVNVENILVEIVKLILIVNSY